MKAIESIIGSGGTDTVTLPSGRSVTLVRTDNDTWREAASDFGAAHVVGGSNVTVVVSNGLAVVSASATGGGSAAATNIVLPVIESTLTNGQVVDLSVAKYLYFTNNCPTNNLSIAFTNAVAGTPVQVFITGITNAAITNITYTWPGACRWYTWTNTYVSTNKVLALSITPLRTNLVHVAGKEDAR